MTRLVLFTSLLRLPDALVNNCLGLGQDLGWVVGRVRGGVG